MTDEEEEDVTAQLLRLAGAPPDPPADRTARVREAVRREWRVNRRRRQVVRIGVLALPAIAASLMLAVWMQRPGPTAPAVLQVVAVGQRVQGQPLIMRQAAPSEGLQPLLASSTIYGGDLIETNDSSRVALLTADGSSVRLDRGTRLRFLAPAVIQVVTGAAYVATSSKSHGLEVRTAFGAVRDLGTKFEVRLMASSLRLRVRSGKVEIGRGADITTAESGTEATVTTAGITIRRLAVYGADWAWATGVAPAFGMEGRTLRAFLEYLTGEQGWTLQYGDPAMAEAAGRIILHGSVEGLDGEEALSAALATSGFQYRLHDGVVLVSRAPDAR